jgi:hypothetical protein
MTPFEDKLDLLNKNLALKTSPLLKHLLLSQGRSNLIEILMDATGDRNHNSYVNLSDDFLVAYVFDQIELGKL